MGSRIMVFGAGGQVGTHLIEIASRSGHHMVALTRSDADICDADAVAAAIAEHAPTVIVNAAAYTAVDRAESEEDRAFHVNRDGAAMLARAAARVGVPLVHISTDYVFDGSARVAYDENHEVSPQGAYARSKEAGERAVRASHGKHLILRTAWIYGPFGSNFVNTMLRFGAEHEEVRVVNDQTGCPTSSGDLAEAILSVAESADKPGFAQWGTYHYAGADAVTWHDFAAMIFAEAEKFGREAPRLHAIATAEFPTPAPRPAYSVLCTAKLERIFGIKPRPLRAGLNATLERLLGGRQT